MTEFLDTMPAAYARAFTPSEILDHEKVVARRGAHLVHAEICVGPAGEHVCVVAEDRPGLLALVTDALLVHGLSIRNAKVYCRQRVDGQSEAIDFFQLQHTKGDLSAGVGTAELAAFLQTVAELVAEEVLAASRASAPPTESSPATRVYFELEALRRGEATLLVEAPDTEGLLNAISNALHAQNVRIRASEIRTEGGFAYDLFELVSNDAQTLNAVRLCDIQQAVHAALPKLGRR
jgi:UTP:GlnB (protein PII) uridylyltransferase